MNRLNWILSGVVVALSVALIGTVVYYQQSELALTIKLLQDKETVLDEKDRLISEKTSLLSEKDTLLLRIQRNLESIRQLEEGSREVAALREENRQLSAKIQRQSRRASELERDIANKEMSLVSLNRRIAKLEGQIEQQDLELSSKADVIKSLSGQLDALNGRLTRYEAAQAIELACLDENGSNIQGTLTPGQAKKMQFLMLAVSQLPDFYRPSTLDVVVGYVHGSNLNGDSFEHIFHGQLEYNPIDSTYWARIPTDKLYKEGYYRVRIENADKESIGRDYVIDFQY